MWNVFLQCTVKKKDCGGKFPLLPLDRVYVWSIFLILKTGVLKRSQKPFTTRLDEHLFNDGVTTWSNRYYPFIICSPLVITKPIWSNTKWRLWYINFSYFHVMSEFSSCHPIIQLHYLIGIFPFTIPNVLLNQMTSYNFVTAWDIFNLFKFKLYTNRSWISWLLKPNQNIRIV